MFLPKLDMDFGELYRMILSPIRAKILLTGIELKVFNYMTEPISAKKVAEAIKTHPRNIVYSSMD
jgi:hypothetical protein